MNSSENIGGLASALVKAQSAMGAAKKSATNPHLKTKYADLTAVWDAVAGPLHQNNLAIVQGVAGGQGTVTVTTRLIHSTGEWLEDAVTLPFGASKGINECQAAGLAITYARRYGLSAMLSLPTEDDDGHGAGESRTGDNGQQGAAPGGGIGPCPICKGPMYDNRGDKTNPNSPDGKCKDKTCKGRIWPSKEPAAGPTLEDAIKSVLTAGSLEDPPIDRQRLEETAGKSLEDHTIDQLRGLREEIKAGTLPPF